MSRLSYRLERLERLISQRQPLPTTAFVDGPPVQTREEWLARRDAERAGQPPPISTAMNLHGETREAWLARRHRELEGPADGPRGNTP